MSQISLFEYWFIVQDAETDSIEEEVEPKLKYVRISNDLQRILNKDAVSCIAVNSKVSVLLQATYSVESYCSHYIVLVE